MGQPHDLRPVTNHLHDQRRMPILRHQRYQGSLGGPDKTLGTTPSVDIDADDVGKRKAPDGNPDPSWIQILQLDGFGDADIWRSALVEFYGESTLFGNRGASTDLGDSRNSVPGVYYGNVK